MARISANHRNTRPVIPEEKIAEAPLSIDAQYSG